MGHIDFVVNYFQHLKLLFATRLLVALTLLLCCPVSSIPALSAEGGGWHLEGPPIIEKSRFVDNEYYFGQKLSISDGSASGTVNWSDGSKCGGTYVGSVTWTPPPSFMLPGSKINFSMTAKTTVNNTCGSRSIDSFGWIKAEGVTIVKALEERSPSASGTYTVPTGSPGQKMQMWATVKVANLNGTVSYNYVYKGAGTTLLPSAKPPTSEDPPPGQLIDKLPIPEQGETLAFITRVDGNPIYVSADPADMPPSQRKWRKIMPGKDKAGNQWTQRLGKGWTVHTPAGSEAVITYKTTAFVIMQPKSLFVVRQEEMATADTKEIYGHLIEGIARFLYDPKKAKAMEKFEVETDLALTSIKGTDFTIETNRESSTFKVIAGTIEITHKILKQVVSITAGQLLMVTRQAIGKVSPFDVAYEKARWISFNSMLSSWNKMASTSSSTQNVTQGNWVTQANEFRGTNGQRFTFYFPPAGAISDRVWGTDIYTADCSIASAAVHAGLITTVKGGTVTIEIRAGQASYKGTDQNGVTSHDWGAYNSSFIFISGVANPGQQPDAQSIQGNWNTQANAYERKSGQRFTFYFPAGGTISSRVWGTDIYTDDCSIASAAVHAGLITAAKGGTVTIEIRAGQSAYKGSLRNGVQSKDWGAFGGSFVFIR